MNIKELGRWTVHHKTEVFYDRFYKHYIVKSKGNIEVKPIGIRASFTVNMDKPSQELCSQNFTHLQINVPRCLICCVTQDSNITLFRYNSFKKFTLGIDHQKILGFHFLSNPDIDCFFFIVTTSSLTLYKSNQSTSKVSVIKSFQVAVFDYSIEENQGILALISPQGKISVYDLYQTISKNYFLSTFDLIFDKNANRFISSGPKSCNLLTYSSRLDYNQVSLCQIYGNLYLVHLENLHGKLFLFSLTRPEYPSLYAAFSLSQGLYSLGFTENLIILINYNTEETLIYDINNHLKDYLVKISHSELIVSNTPTMLLDISPGLFFLDSDIMADLKDSSLKTIEMNPALLIENHSDDIKVILFLLNRVNCKMKVLEKIKDSILQKIPTKKIEVVFSTLAKAYKRLQQDNNIETNNKKIGENSEHLEEGNSESQLNIEMKNEVGLTILLQSDLYFCVFAGVYKETDDMKYFGEILYLFIYYLILNEIDVSLSIQYLLFKVLLKNQDFVRIQKLVEIKFFNDSQDIALVLTSLGKTEKIKEFPNCFNLGIDMLSRLKLHDLAAQELADQEYYYETLNLIIEKKLICSALWNEVSPKCQFSLDLGS